ncbi:hypothetical protein FKM82_024611 [Ascaphus truei]
MAVLILLAPYTRSATSPARHAFELDLTLGDGANVVTLRSLLKQLWGGRLEGPGRAQCCFKPQHADGGKGVGVEIGGERREQATCSRSVEVLQNRPAPPEVYEEDLKKWHGKVRRFNPPASALGYSLPMYTPPQQREWPVLWVLSFWSAVCSCPRG